MFVKLKIENPFTPYTFLTSNDIRSEFCKTEGGLKYGIRYFRTNLDTKRFGFAVPEDILQDFTFDHMKINDRVIPHTDSYIKCSINFYIATSNCETIFYQRKQNASSIKEGMSPYQANGRNYHYRDVTPVGSFIANPYEVWLLDTTKIHSVEPLGEGLLYRDAIVLQTRKYSFDKLKSICETYGSI